MWYNLYRFFTVLQQICFFNMNEVYKIANSALENYVQLKVTD
jgi:hypothetical protein